MSHSLPLHCAVLAVIAAAFVLGFSLPASADPDTDLITRLLPQSHQSSAPESAVSPAPEPEDAESWPDEASSDASANEEQPDELYEPYEPYEPEKPDEEACDAFDEFDAFQDYANEDADGNGENSRTGEIKESMSDFMQVLDLVENIVNRRESEKKQKKEAEISIPELKKFPKNERSGIKKILHKANEAAQKTCSENESCVNARIHEVKIEGDPKNIREGEALDAEVTVYVITRMPARLVKQKDGWELK